MKLIVGLGNPGKEFIGTRHNIGFDIIDYLKFKLNVDDYHKNMSGLFTSFTLDGEKVILLKPQRYMNLSGTVVKEFMNFYKISIEDVLVVHDDIDLDFGILRLKINSSSGGHNGVKNIEQQLQTKLYKRLKVGIGRNSSFEAKDFVLGKFNLVEKQKKKDILELAATICLDFLKMDFDQLMNKYN
jgi:PTH1 family peptidyl-tRNA hydrolase